MFPDISFVTVGGFSEALIHKPLSPVANDFLAANNGSPGKQVNLATGRPTLTSDCKSTLGD